MKYMNTKEAAEIWGVTPTTVTKWCREEKIIFVVKPEKISGKWRIPVGAKYPVINKNNQKK